MPKVRQLIEPRTEQSLVACVLQDCARYDATVQPGDFHDEYLGRIWAVCGELFNLGEYFDAVSVADVLEHRHIDTGPTFTRLMALDVNVFDAPIYARQVKELAFDRRNKTTVDSAYTAILTGNGNKRERLRSAFTEGLRLLDETETPAQPRRITGWTASELLDADFPEPVWAVPGLVPDGLTFLAGRPKVGKSWLALQIAIAKSTGGMVLDRRVSQGNVLYLALEDGGRRLKERTSKQGMPRSAALRFETTWPRLTDGGIDALERAITDNRYTLVVIDTLGRLFGRADQSDLADMTLLVGALQEMAIRHDMAILAIDHHRKPSGYDSDPIDDIVGSTAKSAVTDAALGLSKEQGKRGATLKVTGRDIEWQDLALSWDTVTCCWQYEGTTEEVKLQGRKGDVLDALRASGAPMTLTEIARDTDMDKRNVQPILNDLVNDGVIERLAKVGRDVPYKLRG